MTASCVESAVGAPRSLIGCWLGKSSTNIAASEDFSKKLSVILSSSIRHDILVLIHIELEKLPILEKKNSNLTPQEAKSKWRCACHKITWIEAASSLFEDMVKIWVVPWCINHTRPVLTCYPAGTRQARQVPTWPPISYPHCQQGLIGCPWRPRPQLLRPRRSIRRTRRPLIKDSHQRPIMVYLILS